MARPSRVSDTAIQRARSVAFVLWPQASDDMSIREMELNDMSVVLKLINDEGWGYTSPEIERMLKLEPGGTFIWEDKEPIGVITTVVHNHVGVIGHFVVSAKARGKGIGRALLKRGLEHIQSRNADSVIVIATDDGVPVYKKHGFRFHREILCKHYLIDDSHTKLPRRRPEPMRRGDLETIAAIDSQLFGDERRKLVSLLYEESPRSCFKVVEEGWIVGYCMGRKTATGYDFGPWVCPPGELELATELFNATLSSFGPGRIFCGFFAENGTAVAIADRLPLFRMWSTKLMVLGKGRCYPHIDRLYGIAAFELG